MNENNSPPHWGAFKRILFRFAFVYLALYMLPWWLGLPIFFPHGWALYQTINQPFADLWDAVVPRVGTHVFQVEVTVSPIGFNGSGDTTYDYVQVFCYLMLALAAAVVWTLLDRKRTAHVRLSEWLRVSVRFTLATAMIAYGAAKVMKAQFYDPWLDRLVQPFGDASPHGLLWTFMGASEGYNIFTGAAEMLGGLLLTARRTALLGALVSGGVLANIVALNVFYDVPVKLFSSHLLALAVFLAARDLRRLVNFFVLNRTADPAEFLPLLASKWPRRSALVLRTALVAVFVGLTLSVAHESRRALEQERTSQPLYGIWNVEELEVDGQLRPPLLTDEARWRRVIVDRPGVIAVQLVSDARDRYWLNATENTLELSGFDNPSSQATFSFRRPASGLLELEGTMDGRRVRAVLRRSDRPQFRLVTRGFHWINEVPFNP